MVLVLNNTVRNIERKMNDLHEASISTSFSKPSSFQPSSELEDTSTGNKFYSVCS